MSAKLSLTSLKLLVGLNFAIAGNLAVAQSAQQSSVRSSSGWKASSSAEINTQGLSVQGSTTRNSNHKRSDETTVIQTSYFQSPSGYGENLPVLPYPGPTTGSNGGQMAPQAQPAVQPPVLPSMPNGSLSDSYDRVVTPPVLPNSSSLPSSNVQTQVMPPQAVPPQYNSPNQRLPQSSPPPPLSARSESVLPPNANSNVYNQSGTSGDYGQNRNQNSPMRSTPAANATYNQNALNQNGYYQDPNNSLRDPVRNNAGQGYDNPNAAVNGLRPQQSYANNLPYVTPPPRTGNYPTSPYQGPQMRTIGYQYPVQQSPGFTPIALSPQQTPIPSQPVRTQLVSAQVAQQPAVLPQYATPGIYPTAYQQCTPVPTLPSNGAVPGTYVPPTLTPNLTPGLYTPNNAGYTPLFSLGQENYNVMIGRGIIGQPTVYVTGQPVRNFLRYLSP